MKIEDVAFHGVVIGGVYGQFRRLVAIIQEHEERDLVMVDFVLQTG